MTNGTRATTRALRAVAVITLLLVGEAPRAEALLAAPITCVTSVPPLRTTLPRTGGLVVTEASCVDRASTHVVTSTFGGLPEALDDEVLAPGLHRRVPRGGFAPGVPTIEGLSALPLGLVVSDTDGSPPPAPSVRWLRRSSRTVTRRDVLHGGTSRSVATRITMQLRAPIPDGVVAIAVRWVDWIDVDHGTNGAWARVTPGARRFVLMCAGADDCETWHGQLPRHQERFVARFVDEDGQVSEGSEPWVVTGESPR